MYEKGTGPLVERPRRTVEMAGVEPASEEKTTQTTTCVVCLSLLPGAHPADRTLTRPSRVFPLAAGFAPSPQAGNGTILLLIGAPSGPCRPDPSERAT